MKIYFENQSCDLEAEINIIHPTSLNIIVVPLGKTELEIDDKAIIFSLQYNRNFAVSEDELIENDSFLGKKINTSVLNSIGNMIVQIRNTYNVEDLMEDDIISVNDRAHYVPVTKKEAFYKCVPALYYFGQAECRRAKISVVSSESTNREGFLKFYKCFTAIMNLSGYFRIIKAAKQMKKQKRISDSSTLTKTFKHLYGLSYEEREYQFKPLLVIVDRFIDNLLSKIPKRIRAKIKLKIDDFKAQLLAD